MTITHYLDRLRIYDATKSGYLTVSRSAADRYLDAIAEYGAGVYIGDIISKYRVSGAELLKFLHTNAGELDSMFCPRAKKMIRKGSVKKLTAEHYDLTRLGDDALKLCLTKDNTELNKAVELEIAARQSAEVAKPAKPEDGTEHTAIGARLNERLRRFLLGLPPEEGDAPHDTESETGGKSRASAEGRVVAPSCNREEALGETRLDSALWEDDCGYDPAFERRLELERAAHAEDCSQSPQTPASACTSGKSAEPAEERSIAPPGTQSWLFPYLENATQYCMD